MSDPAAPVGPLGTAVDGVRPGLVALVAGTALNRLYQQGVVLAILVLTARWLGPDGRGVLAAAIAWVQLAGTAVGMSLGKVGFVQSTSPGGEGLSRPLLATLIAVFGAMFAIVCALTLGMVLRGIDLLPGFTLFMIVFVVVSIPLYVWEDMAFYLLTSQSSLSKNLLAVSLGRSLSLLLLFVLVFGLALGVEGAMSALVLGQIVSGVITFRLAYRAAHGPFRVGTSLLRDQVAKCALLHPQTLAVAVFGTSDVLMLHAFSGGSAAGIYQAAWMLMAIPVFTSAPVGNVLFQLVAERGPDGAWSQQLRLMAWVLGVFVACALAIWFLSPSIVGALLGPAFLPSAPILVGLLPFGLAQVLSNLMTPQWVGRRMLAPASTIMVSLAVLSIGLNWFLIPSDGVWGAVVTSWIVALGWIAANAGLAVAIGLRGGTR